VPSLCRPLSLPPSLLLPSLTGALPLLPLAAALSLSAALSLVPSLAAALLLLCALSQLFNLSQLSCLAAFPIALLTSSLRSSPQLPQPSASPSRHSNSI
jgi:hypothetical protein